MSINRPRIKSPGGMYCTDKETAVVAALLGHSSIGTVAITEDQHRDICHLYGYQIPFRRVAPHGETAADKKERKEAVFMDSGAFRNMARYVEMDGVRLVAVLAKYLEPEEDPVIFVMRMMSDAGYDVFVQEDE